MDERVQLLRDRLEIILCDAHLLPFDAGDEEVPQLVRDVLRAELDTVLRLERERVIRLLWNYVDLSPHIPQLILDVHLLRPACPGPDMNYILAKCWETVHGA